MSHNAASEFLTMHYLPTSQIRGRSDFKAIEPELSPGHDQKSKLTGLVTAG